ncbi:hypothetical protein F2Q70_00026794 [Brassica cretica]|uniref:Uncharacterized protein n=1 Tax=Brassica cretica TaxID=69181 RepID=A0A8S9LDC8_BRACR|nr:hypothetical protein F2Q70_00026794 [Brassica cretica]
MSEAFASADDIKSSFFQVSYDQIYDEWIAMRLIDPAGFVLRKVLRSSDNHVDSATIVVVSFVVRPSSAFIPGLVSLRGLLRRRISVRLRGAISLEDEIFYADYFRELSN